MQSLAELDSWRPQVNAEAAEARVRWLRERIADADLAIAAQQRIIESDGPLEAYLLSAESLRLSQRQAEMDLAEVMQQREREVINFALAGNRYEHHRASSRTLVDFLQAMQRLFERVGQAVSSPRIGTIVPAHIRDVCSLEVAGFYPSSFGIRFTTETRADLTGDSLSGQALEATFDLINSSDPAEQIARLGPRVMNNYRHLVNTLVKHEASPKAQWKTPAGDVCEWTMDAYELRRLSNRLASIREIPPKTVETVGVLTGANLRRHRFELTGEHGTITGVAPAELSPRVTTYFGKPCRVIYVETTFLDESTDQEKRSRTLIDIGPAE